MVGYCLPEIDCYSYGTRPWMGTPKVSSHWDADSAHLLMGVVNEVHPWVSAPIHATNNLCLVILTSGILNRRPYTFPI
jgi:hypothetical protein